MPKVSVIINLSKRPQFLTNAIFSVLAQDESDFELLVLDCSSPEIASDIVASFGDSRLRYLRHDPMSHGAARNLGVKEAKSEFIAFLNEHDQWLPNKLRVQLELFNKGNPKVALAYGGFHWFSHKGKTLYEHRPQLRGKILEELLWQKDAFAGSSSNPMLRKSAVVKLGGFNEREDIAGADWELYLRLAESYLIECRGEILSLFRRHRGPLNNYRAAANLEKMLMEQFRTVFNYNPELRSFYFQKIGGKLIRAGEYREGRKFLQQAAFTRGVNSVALIQYGLSFMGQRVYRRSHRIYQAARLKHG